MVLACRKTLKFEHTPISGLMGSVVPDLGPLKEGTIDVEKETEKT